MITDNRSAVINLIIFVITRKATKKQKFVLSKNSCHFFCYQFLSSCYHAEKILGIAAISIQKLAFFSCIA
jgi:hypothetical protein